MSHPRCTSVPPSLFPFAAASLALALVACGDDDGVTPPGPDGGGDGGVEDSGPVVPRSTAQCHYEAVPANANATGMVAPGAITAGAAEEPIDLPVGSALGAYTARADFEGSASVVDHRYAEISGSFNPSVGIETRMRSRAIAITAGGETSVLVKLDIGASDDNITFAVAERLGPEFHGKVIFASSHSHSAWGHFQSNTALGVGFGRFRKVTFDRIVDSLTRVAQRALDARRPARIGIAHDAAFDPPDRVNHDRRGENDALPNGRNRKDHDLYVIRIDGTDGLPIAMVPVFGMHGIIMDADNNLASTDAPGAVERAVEEAFDSEVVVMHLQGAGGDVSPSGSGGIDCSGSRTPCTRNSDCPTGELCPAGVGTRACGAPVCYNFARAETVGRYARDAVMAAWESAGMAMQDSLAMEMVTRAVPLGPDWTTFTVRSGALSYAPWDGRRYADRMIFSPTGEILSPIDEFNAPNGAALCGEDHDAIFYRGQMPRTAGADMLPYRSCVRIEEAAGILGLLIDLPFDRNGNGDIDDDEMPECASTRTTISALRLGDTMIVTLPGEPVTLLMDHVKSLSPFPADKTIVVGYSQGHIGYLLTADDWLLGGYEPSINFWGPLEGEYLAERAADLMTLAASPARDDGAAGGTTRWAGDTTSPDTIPGPDPAPMAGMVPAAIPELVYARGGTPGAAQPPMMVPRLQSARFTWIGEDPLASTPRVTLQREATPGAGDFVDVVRHSGRAVSDGDLLLIWTPDPLQRVGSDPRTHYWVVEWQAVTPWGTPMLDDVEDRPGVPLGRYRFHVEGTGYMVDSSAFEVIPAALTVTATLAGTNVNLDVGYDAPGGWRLLALNGNSNEHVPLARGPVTVELGLMGGGTRTFMDVPVTAGAVTVDAGADAANVRTVRVLDRFTNAGSATL